MKKTLLAAVAALSLPTLMHAAMAQNVVTGTVAPVVAVYDHDHHPIGTRNGSALVNRPVLGAKDAFGFVNVDLGPEKVWVRGTAVTVSNTVPPPPAGPCLVLGPQAQGSQTGSTNGMAGRCKSGK